LDFSKGLDFLFSFFFGCLLESLVEHLPLILGSCPGFFGAETVFTDGALNDVWVGPTFFLEVLLERGFGNMVFAYFLDKLREGFGSCLGGQGYGEVFSRG
jgi:hypothetical protein